MIQASCVDLLEVFSCTAPSVNLILYVPDASGNVQTRFIYLGPLPFSPLTISPFSLAFYIQPGVTVCFFMNSSNAERAVNSVSLRLLKQSFVCEAGIASLQYTSVQRLTFDSWGPRLPLTLSTLLNVQYVEVLGSGLACDCYLAVNFYKYFTNRSLISPCLNNTKTNAATYIKTNWQGCLQNSTANQTFYYDYDSSICKQKCSFTDEIPSKRNCSDNSTQRPKKTTTVITTKGPVLQTTASVNCSTSDTIGTNQTTTIANIKQAGGVHISLIISLAIAGAILATIIIFVYCTWRRSREGENLLKFWRIWSRSRAVPIQPLPPLLSGLEKSNSISGVQSTD